MLIHVKLLANYPVNYKKVYKLFCGSTHIWAQTIHEGLAARNSL